MKFILITGPQAVGKMTVGKLLAEETGLVLFHNHMTLELTSAIFGRGRKECMELSDKFRMDIFRAVAKSDLSGLIFTFVWPFDLPEMHMYVEQICEIFRSSGHEIYIVELEADLETRLARNQTELRMKLKPSKRDTEFSEKDLRSCHQTNRLNSLPGEIVEKNYIRISNTHKSPEEVVATIRSGFSF